jgi:hypothetical protein
MENTLPYIGPNDEANKEGCGRVCFWQELGLIHSYTLECNYQTGKRLNHLNPRVDSFNNNYRMPEPAMKDIHNKAYQENRVILILLILL